MSSSSIWTGRTKDRIGLCRATAQLGKSKRGEISFVTVSDIAESFGLQIRAGSDRLLGEVTGGYASDLLSDVIAHSRKGNIWITLQTHPNIVAVATMKELAGIILTGGREPDAETVQKAVEEGIPLLVSPLFTFELAGRLYQIGFRE